MSSEEDNKVDTQIATKLRRASEYYLQNTELRTLVSLIPGVGPSLDLIISSEAQKIQYQRLIQTLNQIREEMNAVQESQIDKGFLKSEEFFDILMRAFELCMKTREMEKRRLYCRILASSVLLDNREFRQSSEDFLYLLSELTPADISVAGALYKVPVQGNAKQEYYEHDAIALSDASLHETSTKLGMNVEELRIVLVKLVRAGLVKEKIITAYDYAGGSYIITPVFYRLMQFVKSLQ